MIGNSSTRHHDVSGKGKRTERKTPRQVREEEEQEIFSFRSHNMQYFDSQGVKERTGYGEPKDWYLMVIKELLDNAVDYLQKYHRGATNAKVTAIFTISEDGSEINYKVRNSNPDNKLLEAFEVEELKKYWIMTCPMAQNKTIIESAGYSLVTLQSRL